VISKPAELARWELVDMLAQRYHVLPSAVLAEDVSLLRGLSILAVGRKDG